MLHLLEVLVIAGTLVVLVFLILLALPQCRLRQLVMPFVAWGFVVLCALYAVSPVDVLPEIVMGPFGLVDDAAAIIAGVGTAMATIKAQREKHPNYQDKYFN